MLENHIYNLMEQIVVESKSLWRINKRYKQDADDCTECQAFWEKLDEDKEEHIEELTELIKAHLK
jgi:acid phosphatase class B